MSFRKSVQLLASLQAPSIIWPRQLSTNSLLVNSLSHLRQIPMRCHLRMLSYGIRSQAQKPSLYELNSYKSVTEADKKVFFQILEKNPSCLIDTSDPDALEQYNHDWIGKYIGQSKLVLRPKTTQQVSEILRYCHKHNIAVVPQGGNTGLVGGSVPVHDEVILSTQLMNNIESFDPVSGILTCQSGCVLEILDQYVAEKGFIMPLDLGAKGSCHIGGNVATNAGGLRLLRYGSLHGSVLALEVVLADGTVLNTGLPLRKDNTGYDLKQLFIGSEGTLGVITKVSILTPPRPTSSNVALLAIESFEDVQKVFVQARRQLGEILSAFELFDRASLDLVTKHISGTRDPFTSSSPYYVLIETSGSNEEHDADKLATFLEAILEDSIISDGILAQDATQLQSFWRIRECIPEACSKEGRLYKYDLSLPVANLYQIVQDFRDSLQKVGLYSGENAAVKDPSKPHVKSVVGFAHMGDGNIHLNIMASEWTDLITKEIEPLVYELTQKYGGSISAEHGVGQMKKSYLNYSKEEAVLDWMKAMKKLYDPKGILNPFKYFD